jgi:hypothetical protein
MYAVTGYRRLTILAIAALLAPGCGASPDASDPSAGPATGPSQPTSPSKGPMLAPSPSEASPGMTVVPAPTPADGCPSLDDVDLSRLEVELGSVYPDGDGGIIGFSIGHVGGELQVTRIVEQSGQRRSAVPPERKIRHDRGQLLGGREFVTFPSDSFEGSRNPQAMIEANVTLELDGAAPIDLPTRFVPGNRNFDQVAVAVPDVNGRGSLRLAFIWADACFRYEASDTIPVDVVPLEQTSGCDLGNETYWDQLHAVLHDSIKVGTTKPAVGSAFNESKFAPFVNPGIDAFIGYMFDADAPELGVVSGRTVRIENLKPRIELAVRMKVVIWTRRSIARAVTDYPPRATVEVSQGRLERLPDGSYELPVPEEPGRYVAALSVEFETACTVGTMWSVVNLSAA